MLNSDTAMYSSVIINHNNFDALLSYRSITVIYTALYVSIIVPMYAVFDHHHRLPRRTCQLFRTASWDSNRLKKELGSDKVERLENVWSASGVVLRLSNMPNIEELLLSLKRRILLFYEGGTDAATDREVMTWFTGIIKSAMDVEQGVQEEIE